MIFISCAFPAEARPLIDFYMLKKIPRHFKFEVYEGEDLVLVISGMGAVMSAAALSHVLTLYSAKNTDVAVNIGIAGAVNEIYKRGDLILCNKIVNTFSERCFYPDILVKHDFKEGTLLTYPRPVLGREKVLHKGDLVDMEGAGFFEAASSFLYIHNIQVIKVIYDFLDDLTVKRDEIYKLIGEGLAKIDSFLKTLEKANELIENPLTPEDERILAQIARNLGLTFTMEKMLYNLALAYKIVKKEKDLKFLEGYLGLKPNSKKEGKYYFELIKERLKI